MNKLFTFNCKHCGFYLSFLKAICQYGDLHVLVACGSCGESFDRRGERTELVPPLIVL